MTRDPQKHLTQDEFIGYFLEELPELLEQELDQHLEQCPACTKQLEEFYIAQEQFPAQAWTAQRGAFVASLRQRIFGPSTLWQQLAAQLNGLVLSHNVALAAAHVATAPPQETGQTEDGILRWRIVEDTQKNLIIRIGSHNLNLEGTRLRLQAGEWQHEVILSKVTSSQVGVETVISHERRRRLFPNTGLDIELIGEDADSSAIGSED